MRTRKSGHNYQSIGASASNHGRSIPSSDPIKDGPFLEARLTLSLIGGLVSNLLPAHESLADNRRALKAVDHNRQLR